MYQNTSDSKKDNLQEHSKKQKDIYQILKQTHAMIAKRLEDGKK
jgi:hypothetical protein